MKTHALNNYPREGEHSAVTALGVRKLEKGRLRRNLTVDYTIGGSVEAEVHTTIEAAREYAITRGHRILIEASQTVRHEAQTAMKPTKLDMQSLKQEARDHIKHQFQSHSQSP